MFWTLCLASMYSNPSTDVYKLPLYASFPSPNAIRYNLLSIHQIHLRRGPNLFPPFWRLAPPLFGWFHNSITHTRLYRLWLFSMFVNVHRLHLVGLSFEEIDSTNVTTVKLNLMLKDCCMKRLSNTQFRKLKNDRDL